MRPGWSGQIILPDGSLGSAITAALPVRLAVSAATGKGYHLPPAEALSGEVMELTHKKPSRTVGVCQVHRSRFRYGTWATDKCA